MADNDGGAQSPVDSVEQLAADLSVIVREDLAAAKDEMLEKIKEAGMGAGMMSGSLLTAFLMLFSLTVLLIVALSGLVKLWIAALIVTLLWGAATAVLALGGKRKLQHAGAPVPERAIADLKADVQAAKDQVADRRR